MLHRKPILLMLVAIPLFALFAWAFLAPVAPAAPLFQGTPTPAPTTEGEDTRTPVPNLSISDEYCLSCHGQP